MRPRVTAVALLLAAGQATLHAQTQDRPAGLIYGPHHAFFVSAPPGWILDNRIGVSDGLYAVFYRVGQTWRDGEAVMYVNTVGSDSTGHAKPPERVIQEDAARFRAESPGVVIEAGSTMHTQDHREALVRMFRNDSHGNFEAVAYVRERTVTPILVLTARSFRAFQQALPAFRQLVRSYAFFTDSVVTK